jgi:sugar O-acyltransferase (sialic acid O-acetyltransferase NeuD family)
MSALWIAGAGGHGGVVADAARASGLWRDMLFFDDRLAHRADGVETAGSTTALIDRCASAAPESFEVIVAFGDNVRRLELSERLLAAGARLATVVHPFTAISASAVVGAGSVVLAGAVLNPGARVGRAAIVNTRASVDHDCAIGNGVHLCPGATLAGNVVVDDLAWIGIGACVIQGVSIGRSAVVGAGAAVIADVGAGTVVVGNPAREKHLGN